VNVRSNIVFVLLLSMLGALVFFAVTRERTPHAAPAAAPGPGAADAEAADAGVESGVEALEGSASATRAEAKDGGTTLDHPLRVVAMGWEVLAAGVVANGGRSPDGKSAFAAAHVEVRLRAADAMSDVEAQLARGGADEGGADVAIVPLPSFAASYERLRALEPEAFLVVGWSRGREAIVGATEASLVKAPKAQPGDEVRLATGHGDAATAFSLFVLDTAGIPPARVRLVNDPKGAQFAAATRPLPLETSADAPNKLLLTTADAPLAVPLVAVAPHGLIETQGDLLKTWCKIWLEGLERLRKDVPAAARLVTQEPGAPEASALLERHGQIEPATVSANARALGLSGRSAVTLPVLFQRYFRLWREIGALSVPAPDTAPVATSVFSALVRSDPALAERPAAEPARNPPAKPSVLLVHRIADAKVDEDALVADVGFLASVFDRGALRVSTRPAALAKSAIEDAYGRFDIASGRLLAGAAPRAGGAPAAIEVLVGP
jgi:hypothetical protein